VGQQIRTSLLFSIRSTAHGDDRPSALLQGILLKLALNYLCYIFIAMFEFRATTPGTIFGGNGSLLENGGGTILLPARAFIIFLLIPYKGMNHRWPLQAFVISRQDLSSYCHPCSTALTVQRDDTEYAGSHPPSELRIKAKVDRGLSWCGRPLVGQFGCKRCQYLGGTTKSAYLTRLGRGLALPSTLDRTYKAPRQGRVFGDSG
jgi:hypothetical protein